ncbi:hypothetical protein KCU81_g433, partial [Aureobasidium melanogenum]
MFGAFKPTSALSGGLLWKIPWRLSAPQKLRQRRRLRRVDNIVSVLDSALQRQVQSQPATTATKGIGATQATTGELSQTAQGQRLMNAETNAPLNELRHGRGPRQGDILSGSLPTGTVTMTGDQARKMGTIKLLERWKADMPTEAEMLPRDKYTMFDRKEKKYRKGIHKLPKWTRVSQRVNPPDESEGPILKNMESMRRHCHLRGLGLCEVCLLVPCSKSIHISEIEALFPKQIDMICRPKIIGTTVTPKPIAMANIHKHDMKVKIRILTWSVAGARTYFPSLMKFPDFTTMPFLDFSSFTKEELREA